MKATDFMKQSPDVDKVFGSAAERFWSLLRWIRFLYPSGRRASTLLPEKGGLWSQDVKESLAFLFFKDGIREIQFFRGLEFREVVDFLSIVRKADSINRLEDDPGYPCSGRKISPTRHLPTIDEFLEEGVNFVPATVEDLSMGLEYKGSGEEGQGIDQEEEKEEAHSLKWRI